jgi:hypothetical protein
LRVVDEVDAEFAGEFQAVSARVARADVVRNFLLLEVFISFFGFKVYQEMKLLYLRFK